MRWEDMRSSDNVEDRRGIGVGRAGGIGIGSILLALIGSWLFGINPLALLGIINTVAPPSAPVQQQGKAPPADDPQARFVSKILGDTEDTWAAMFKQAGAQYRKPTLVIFEDRVASACGLSSAAVGPFYCPEDQKVYLDLSFFNQLSSQFGAPGEFARAYVIAHEVGHHVQTLLGISQKTTQLRQRLSERDANKVSVLAELQADCFAGVWGHYAARRGLIDTRDVEAGLRAAAAIGDDTIMRRSQGRVVPDAMTHGTSEQRQTWFTRGLKTGDMNQCDTFGAALGR